MGLNIVFRDVLYRYPKNDGFVLDIRHFAPAPNACTHLFGRNGSGKTTLGKIGAGLLKPQAGVVLVDAEDIGSWPLGRVGGNVGYLFQEPSRQIFAPSAREEIMFPLTLNGQSAEQAAETADRLLMEFDLAHLAAQSTFTLSRGEKQRLALAAMLAGEPRFFILDEPTTGLDAIRRDILKNTVRTLLDHGAGVLLISHDAAFCKQVATETVRIERGVPLDV